MTLYRKNIESLMQKVNNIIKELKTKDTLLEKAQVHAREAEDLAQHSRVDMVVSVQTDTQSFLFSDPTSYEDKDMYMGDNKGGKWRE